MEKNRNKKTPGVTHGLSKSKTYAVWKDMKRRCFKPNCANYSRYGGRGITVCKRWMKFENFLSDMGQVPKRMSLDRINNEGNYTPSNCRWATREQQDANTRKNVFIEYRGVKKHLRAWTRELNLSIPCIKGRLRKGWSVERTFETPSLKARKE